MAGRDPVSGAPSDGGGPAAQAPPAAPVFSAGLFLRLLGVPLIWGIAFVPGKLAVAGLPAGVAALGRYVMASLSLLAAAWWLEGGLPRPRGRQWLGLAGLGLTGIAAYNLLMFKALESLTASRTAMIVALSPALIAAGSAVFQGEKLRPHRWLGVALALFGAWIVLSHGDLGSLHMTLGPGEACMLGAVGCWVAYTLLSRRVLKNGLSILASTTWSCLLGTLMLMPVAALAWPQLGAGAQAAKPWLAVAFMGIFSTGIAFLWYADGILRIGPARTAVFTNLVPVFAVLSAWLFLGEVPGPSLMIGGAVTLAGVALVNRVK